MFLQYVESLENFSRLKLKESLFSNVETLFFLSDESFLLIKTS